MVTVIILGSGWSVVALGGSWDQEMQMDGVVVCGQVVDVVWDDSTGFNPLELLLLELVCERVCVSLFYVIDTGSTGSRARHSRGELGCTHIYPPPLAQTLAMTTYP
jgi:hypothetical protein